MLPLARANVRQFGRPKFGFAFDLPPRCDALASNVLNVHPLKWDGLRSWPDPEQFRAIARDKLGEMPAWR
jgi:hypothetical protein